MSSDVCAVLALVATHPPTQSAAAAGFRVVKPPAGSSSSSGSSTALLLCGWPGCAAAGCSRTYATVPGAARAADLTGPNNRVCGHATGGPLCVPPPACALCAGHVQAVRHGQDQAGTQVTRSCVCGGGGAATRLAGPGQRAARTAACAALQARLRRRRPSWAGHPALTGRRNAGARASLCLPAGHCYCASHCGGSYPGLRLLPDMIPPAPRSPHPHPAPNTTQRLTPQHPPLQAGTPGKLQ